jgi:hypothetical protein
VDYTTLSLAEVSSEMQNLARDARATFGVLTVRQLNWRPDERRWSVAQCFEHLLTANRLMLRAAREALANPPRTVWQRLPVLPGLFGRVMIRSLTPTATRKLAAPAKARPTTSDLSAGIIDSFVGQHREAAEWAQTVDEHQAARAIMISPFVRFITYSVLDGCRLVVAHDRRHFEQARRVTLSPGFPGL